MARAMVCVLLAGSVVWGAECCLGGERSDWAQIAGDVAARRLRTAQEAVRVRPDEMHGRWMEDATFRLTVDVETRPADADGSPLSMSGGVADTQPAPMDRGPLPGFFDTVRRDLEEAPGLLWHDTKKVFGDPANLVFLLGAGGASAAVRYTVDDRIEDHYDRHRSFGGDWPDTFATLGNPIVHFAAAGVWYLAGQQMQDIKTYEVGKRAFSALAISGATTLLLKAAACTDSPNGEAFAWPSGHVSSTMALATVLHNAYGPLVGVPMFGLTGLVAVQRMDYGEHHFSDVIFGAALGWVVAETIMKEHRPEVFGGEIVPYADPANGSAGVAWVKTLGL